LGPTWIPFRPGVYNIAVRLHGWFVSEAISKKYGLWVPRAGIPEMHDQDIFIAVKIFPENPLTSFVASCFAIVVQDIV